MSKNDFASDVEFIAALAEMLRKNDLTEIEVRREYGEDNTLDVRVARGGVVTSMAAPSHHAPAAFPVAAPAPAAAAQVMTSDPALDPGAITSPMVGTAYLHPEPGMPSFVSVGDKVTEGQTILIVEAMKTMNQIPAPRAGTVRRILVEDGSPVEFGAPLMILD